MNFVKTDIMKNIVTNHIIEERLKNKKERGKYFYASEAYLPHNPSDSKCARQLGYKILGHKPTEERKEMYPIFALGDLYHDFIQKIFVKEGLATQVEEATIIYDDKGRYFYIQRDDNKTIIKEPVEIHGRLDLKFDIEKPFIADIKSISEKGFFYVQDKPKENHYAQVQVYLHDLKKEDINQGFLLYVNKSTGEMSEFLIDYDAEYVLKYLEDYEELYNQIMNEGLPPRHFKSGREIPWQCKYCGYTKICLGLPIEEIKQKTFLSYPEDDIRKLGGL